VADRTWFHRVVDQLKDEYAPFVICWLDVNVSRRDVCLTIPFGRRALGLFIISFETWSGPVRDSVAAGRPGARTLGLSGHWYPPITAAKQEGR